MKDTEKLLEHLCREAGLEKGIRPNSWENIKNQREQLQTDTSKYPWRESFETLWSTVSVAQFDYETYSLREAEDSVLSPVEALPGWFEYPRYPPPEVYIAIVQCFEIYFKAQGKLSLEDVFFGPAKKGVGNLAARKERDDTYHTFFTFIKIKQLQTNPKSLALEDLAEEFLLNDKSIIPLTNLSFNMPEQDFESAENVEAFLKGFQRWKKQWFLRSKSNQSSLDK